MALSNDQRRLMLDGGELTETETPLVFANHL